MRGVAGLNTASVDILHNRGSVDVRSHSLALVVTRW